MLDIKRLSFDEAQILIDGAAEKSREMKIPMCVAITDESGHLIKFDRMDGGKVSSISIAIDKAFTGAVARKGRTFTTSCVNRASRPSEFTSPMADISALLAAAFRLLSVDRSWAASESVLAPRTKTLNVQRPLWLTFTKRPALPHKSVSACLVVHPNGWATIVANCWRNDAKGGRTERA